MINKVAKGRRTELKARKQLERAGYLVDKKPRTRYLSPDIFQLFDLIALNPKTRHLKFIQVKSTASGFYSAKKKIKDWMKKECFPEPIYSSQSSPITFEVWLHRGLNSWRKEIIENV